MNQSVNFLPAARPSVPSLFRRSLRDTVLFFVWFLVVFAVLGYISRWIPALYSVVAVSYLTALRLMVTIFGNLLPDVPSMTWSYLMWLVVPLLYTFLFWVFRFMQLLLLPPGR